MTSTPDFDHARALATKTLEAMDAYGVAASPRNFEIWNAHCRGTNPELTRAINAVFVAGGAWNDESAAAIYALHVSGPTDSEALDDIRAQLGGQLEDVLKSVNQAGDQTKSYGKALDAVSGMMDGALDAAALKALVHQATMATRAMHARAELLETRLNQASQEVESLRTNLESIRQEALTDDLTRLANRKHFDERLGMAAIEADETGQEMCLLMGDVDHFKTFNDNWGHQTGDQVLRLVSQCFRDNIKGRDLAARYGGEEFAVILPGTSLENGRKVAEQIRKSVQAKEIVKRSTGERMGSITMSVGVALYRPGDAYIDTLRRADTSLYAAKRGGRNRVVADGDEPAAGKSAA